MGGRGNSGSSGRNSRTSEVESSVVDQIATRAKNLENMNEAQITQEIDKAQKYLEQSQRVMRENGTESQYFQAMQESFPLGAGGDGWSQSRINQREREIERSVVKAKRFTDALEKAKNLQNSVERMQKVLSEIKGTGKTKSQLDAEKIKSLVKENSAMKWKTTQKAEFTGSSYRPQIISSGDFRIEGSSGIYRVYRGEKLIGSVGKLSVAKALAERASKK